MKTGLFARPNLKLFLFGAMAIVAIEQFIAQDEPLDSSILFETSLGAAPLADDELQRLIEYSLNHPSSDAYSLISDCYRRRGDSKTALLYLRKASLAAQLEHDEF